MYREGLTWRALARPRLYSTTFLALVPRLSVRRRRHGAYPGHHCPSRWPTHVARRAIPGLPRRHSTLANMQIRLLTSPHPLSWLRVYHSNSGIPPRLVCPLVILGPRRSSSSGRGSSLRHFHQSLQQPAGPSSLPYARGRLNQTCSKEACQSASRSHSTPLFRSPGQAHRFDVNCSITVPADTA